MKFQEGKLQLKSYDNENIVVLVKWYDMPDGWYGYTGTMHRGRVLDACFFPRFAWTASVGTSGSPYPPSGVRP